MEALGLGGGGLLQWNFSPRKAKPFQSQSRKSKSSDSVEATGGAGYRFPVKQAAMAGSLALTGDAIAQLIQRWRKQKALESDKYLDRCMPKQTVNNGMTKVLLNQRVLGPCVIAVCFTWNSLWQGTLSNLPNRAVPLHALVALSMGSIFWNFYFSSTMSN